MNSTFLHRVVWLKNLRTGIFFLFLLIHYSSAFSSESPKKQILTGIVIDQENKKPIPLADIYISGTTYGVVCNLEGRFSIEIPFLPCVIIFSHLSYATFPLILNEFPGNDTVILLQAYEYRIPEISVEAENQREDNLELFRQGLLGTDNISAQCRILNDSVLSFRWEGSRFLAKASQPLNITNYYLGYQLKVFLREFTFSYNPDIPVADKINKRNISSFPEGLISYLGEFYFIPFNTESKNKNKVYERNRERVYYGSGMHFLRALYCENLSQQGYSIRARGKYKYLYIKELENSDNFSGIHFINKSGIHSRSLLIPNKMISIEYFNKNNGKPLNLRTMRPTGRSLYSNALLMQDECTVRYNGTTPGSSIMFTGYIGESRVGSMLPSDYMIEQLKCK